MEGMGKAEWKRAVKAERAARRQEKMPKAAKKRRVKASKAAKP
jgi:hypothetical protein